MVSFDDIRAVCLVFSSATVCRSCILSCPNQGKFSGKNLPIEIDQTVVQTVEPKIIFFGPTAAEEFF